MNEHTKEPWEAASNLVRTTRNEDGRGGYLIAECPVYIGNGSADARRIVACVNACAGISTTSLESWMNPPPGSLGAPDGTWAQQLGELWQCHQAVLSQCDELLAACKAIVTWCDGNPPAGEALYCIQLAREAIAKAEGKA